MQESLRKNCPILGKAYMFKGEVTFMRVRVWFDFWRTVILTIRGPRICSTNFGDASGQRHVGGRRRDTHTAKCEHTVKHYCFIDIDILAVQPGVARAFALRSTLSLRSCGSAQLCRFAPAGCAQQGGVENVQYATNHKRKLSFMVGCVLYVFNAPLLSFVPSL